MNLDFALLAEAATPAEGKQFLHGAGLRRIDAPQLPWVTNVAVVASFTAALTEAGDRHELRIRLRSPADDVIVDVPPFEILVPEATSDDVEEHVAQVAVEILLSFTVEGWHRFELELDGEPLVQLRLKIRRVEPESGPPRAEEPANA